MHKEVTHRETEARGRTKVQSSFQIAGRSIGSQTTQLLFIYLRNLKKQHIKLAWNSVWWKDVSGELLRSDVGTSEIMWRLQVQVSLLLEFSSGKIPLKWALNSCVPRASISFSLKKVSKTQLLCVLAVLANFCGSIWRNCKISWLPVRSGVCRIYISL